MGRRNDQENLLTEANLYKLQDGTGIVSLYVQKYLEAQGANFEDKYYVFETTLFGETYKSIREFYDKKLCQRWIYKKLCPCS